MEKKIISVLAFIGICFFSQAQSNFDKRIQSLYRNTVPVITPELLQNHIASRKKIVLFDTRTSEEYKISHLLNAVLIDYKHFTAKQITSLDKNATIVLYCSVGYRSERIGERLQKLGFKNVNNLYGGIFQWKNKGNTIVNSKNNPTDSVHTYNKNWSQWLVRGIIVY